MVSEIEKSLLPYIITVLRNFCVVLKSVGCYIVIMIILMECSNIGSSWIVHSVMTIESGLVSKDVLVPVSSPTYDPIQSSILVAGVVPEPM